MIHFLMKNKVDVVGFLETRVKEVKFNQVCKKFGAGWGSCCNYSHESGGRIWFGWNKVIVAISFGRITAQVLHGRVSLMGSLDSLELTFVYRLHNI